MTSRNARLNAAASVRRRVKSPPSSTIDVCSVWGCERPTQRAEGKGFSTAYCRNHMKHLSRHGHPSRPTYRVWEVEPYRKAAREWIRLNREDRLLLSVVASLDGMLAAVGRPVDAFSIRGKSPQERARILLARLNAARKTGSTLLEIAIAIKAATLELGPHGLPDWEPIQIAKVAKRLRGVSGSILKRYDGTPYLDAQGKKMEKYPAGEGGFMRIAGRKIADRARRVVDDGVIQEVLALRRKL